MSFHLSIFPKSTALIKLKSCTRLILRLKHGKKCVLEIKYYFEQRCHGIQNAKARENVFGKTTGVILRPHKKAVKISACAVFHRVNEDTGGPYSNPSPHLPPHLSKASNVLLTTLVL